MGRRHGYGKKREPTGLCLEFALHGRCVRGDQCTFGHWDDDDITREDYEHLLHNLGKVSDHTLAQAVANVLEAQIATFDDDDDGEPDGYDCGGHVASPL